jgi:hypothetical protein
MTAGTCQWEYLGFDYDFNEHDHDSECGERFHLDNRVDKIENYNFCPNCGKTIYI